jgi:hypothetical protein
MKGGKFQTVEQNPRAPDGGLAIAPGSGPKRLDRICRSAVIAKLAASVHVHAVVFPSMRLTMNIHTPADSGALLLNIDGPVDATWRTMAADPKEGDGTDGDGDGTDGTDGDGTDGDAGETDGDGTDGTDGDGTDGVH